MNARTGVSEMSRMMVGVYSVKDGAMTAGPLKGQKFQTPGDAARAQSDYNRNQLVVDVAEFIKKKNKR